MEPAEGHPTDDDLKRFAVSQLSSGEQETVYDHLRACPACNARYRTLSATIPSANLAPPPIDLLRRPSEE